MPHICLFPPSSNIFCYYSNALSTAKDLFHGSWYSMSIFSGNNWQCQYSAIQLFGINAGTTYLVVASLWWHWRTSVTAFSSLAPLMLPPGWLGPLCGDIEGHQRQHSAPWHPWCYHLAGWVLSVVTLKAIRDSIQLLGTLDVTTWLVGSSLWWHLITKAICGTMQSPVTQTCSFTRQSEENKHV